MPFPAANIMGGTTAAFPDVCNTPTPAGPVPQPYPNMGMLMQANPATVATQVLLSGAPAVNLQSQILMTNGDQSGSMGGLMSGMIMGPARFAMGSVTVMIDGAPAIYQTCQVAANGVSANAPMGLHDSPSQATVLINM
jgi:hypothetical protein